MNAIPVIGWILSLIFTTSTSIPFWICWTACGLGARYFYWLPPVYHSIPFWHCVGLFMVVGILRRAFIPTLASTVTQTNNDK